MKLHNVTISGPDDRTSIDDITARFPNTRLDQLLTAVDSPEDSAHTIFIINYPPCHPSLAMPRSGSICSLECEVKMVRSLI